MLVGLVIKLSPGTIIQHMVQFNGGFFFNLLLPPIILNSGYELKRASDLCQLLIVGKRWLIQHLFVYSKTSFEILELSWYLH
jgi:NhaP-type Na+/H+ or K+/H+ antiporter